MGSDLFNETGLFEVLSFNPRSRMGSDLVQRQAQRLLSLFQSTLPHGERLILIRYIAPD